MSTVLESWKHDIIEIAQKQCDVNYQQGKQDGIRECVEIVKRADKHPMTLRPDWNEACQKILEILQEMVGDE